MKKNVRKMVVTYALTYANGPLHLGHLVGFIQTDTWVRFHKMRGTECVYISGCDAHGTPIMIEAEKMQISPEQLTEDVRAQQQADLKDFFVGIDNYHTTHSPENQTLTETIYQAHLQQGNIHKSLIKQAYDPEKKMFLPDRYIKGTCPRCGAADQYGDSCEVCGATYSPTELKDARSTLSGAKPIEKESEHYFFILQRFEALLSEWTRSGRLQEQVTHKLDEWFENGLKEWDISRDAPYFGFKVPGEDAKYFYCWLDAPIGYMASFQNLCDRREGLNFADYWASDSEAELYHFIGKDIMYFHTLFWPALLQGAHYRMPNAVYCHGFLTIGGQKMSKSRGTFIKGRTYLDHLPPEFLRYYLATKLNNRIEDLDIQFDDFMLRVNADLIGKFVNIASRCASFINKNYDNRLSLALADAELFKEFAKAGDEIADFYEQREFSQAMRRIMSLADRANQYLDEKKPWAAIKVPEGREQVQAVCTLGINLFRTLMIYLKPVLPEMAKKVEAFLEVAPLQWSDKDTPLLNHAVRPFQALAHRLEKTQIEALQEAAKQDIQATISVKPKESHG